MAPILDVDCVSKTFTCYARARDRLAEFFTGSCRHRRFTALDAVSFTLESGQIMSIIGENGSGKSTLLKCIAKVLLPDSGTIRRYGKITGLLELGTGFIPNLSGRENIAFNGTFLQMSASEIARREEAIIDFAELAPFIDEPLKSYSSGMTMRLAFAIAMHADPKCFLIDEALSVGDTGFQQKCFQRLKTFRENGGSILFVSHDMNAVKLLSDQVLLLSHGQMNYLGEAEEAINRYNALAASHGQSGCATSTGYGNGLVHFTSVHLTDPQGHPVSLIRSGDPLCVRFTYKAEQSVAHVTFGIMLRDRFGQDVFGTNGALLHCLKDVSQEGQGCFTFKAINLGQGTYTVNLSAHQGTTHLETCYHWWDRASSFEVLQDTAYYFSGHTRLETQLVFSDKA
ncbi:MAG: ABC transporter ATP-binding protein [Desulfovibrio sp.]|nr:ABC transporter ATP-binding protein [Desulfovibrio sp.]